ncbi:MAG: metallophosphoesterase [Acidobacteriota bacterium]|nr:metallophosphoesterase [Acidobacteriota bacterium]
MLRLIFFAFILLALLGDARMFLFVMNRFVFGSRRQEKSAWQWLLFATPPALLVLTALLWPLGRWIDWLMSARIVERVTPDRIEGIVWSIALAKVGAVWLIIAATVGSYWLLDRIRANYLPPPALAGIRTQPSDIVTIRKAHVPFAALRRLGAHNDVYDIEVTHNEIIIDDLPPSFDGYRIAFLTDTHVASFMRRDFYREVVHQVQRFDPDLILFGGDFVSFTRHIKLLPEILLAGLSARDGLFAILGNHDYWAGADEIVNVLRAHGVRFLTNDAVMLARGAARLPLVGIDEVYRGSPDVDRAFAGLDPGKPCLAISHHPDVVDIIRGQRIDLLLCGHTHGGQIRFPFFGAVVVPSRHESELAAGFHRIGPVLLYVSRGIGAIPPLRILCRPEVATFVLKRGKRSE